jgi:3-methyladenine DNA glycosylase AlkD
MRLTMPYMVSVDVSTSKSVFKDSGDIVDSRYTVYMIATAQHVLQELKRLANPQKALALARFFKTGPGQYGEGDIFLGITVPAQREVAKLHRKLPLTEIQKLLKSKIHEYRFTALEILVMQYEKGNTEAKKDVYHFYIHHTQYINKTLLYKWAKSKNIWERRMAIVATFDFIRSEQFSDTLAISKLFIHDPHDLIHKASGWMLREVGKRDKQVLMRFLNDNAASMPRTMLRYAIERLSPAQRAHYIRQKKSFKQA